MSLERPAFTSTRLDKEKQEKDKIFTVRLNKEEVLMLEKAKNVLEQPKDSTCLKQLAMIGFANVIHDKKTKLILETIFKNKRRNKRTGLVEFEQV